MTHSESYPGENTLDLEIGFRLRDGLRWVFGGTNVLDTYPEENSFALSVGELYSERTPWGFQRRFLVLATDLQLRRLLLAGRRRCYRPGYGMGSAEGLGLERLPACFRLTWQRGVLWALLLALGTGRSRLRSVGLALHGGRRGRLRDAGPEPGLRPRPALRRSRLPALPAVDGQGARPADPPERRRRGPRSSTPSRPSTRSTSRPSSDSRPSVGRSWRTCCCFSWRHCCSTACWPPGARAPTDRWWRRSCSSSRSPSAMSSGSTRTSSHLVVTALGLCCLDALARGQETLSGQRLVFGGALLAVTGAGRPFYLAVLAAVLLATSPTLRQAWGRRAAALVVGGALLLLAGSAWFHRDKRRRMDSLRERTAGIQQRHGLPGRRFRAAALARAAVGARRRVLGPRGLPAAGPRRGAARPQRGVRVDRPEHRHRPVLPAGAPGLRLPAKRLAAAMVASRNHRRTPGLPDQESVQLLWWSRSDRQPLVPAPCTRPAGS